MFSLIKVRLEYPVSYTGQDFIIHRAQHGYSDMIFKPHGSGLYVLDINDPRSHASYAFVVTVVEMPREIWLLPKRVTLMIVNIIMTFTVVNGIMTGEVVYGIMTGEVVYGIITGEVVYYKYCNIPFGCYCQISTKGTPSNSMLVRMAGVKAPGTGGNTQGGHTLGNASVVVRRQRVNLPMTEAVIAKINFITNQNARPGDVAMEHFDFVRIKADVNLQE